ncbi:hypothetical protein AVEN_199899-1 [Araneus ventricosus]|uniref:Uncharacterized protein n=1 Tax=Araneus ventricosus TaxID=182803 RepID=A0A4Y2HP58_ARAVE|nr:hypothetical protein AVEN_199899-1 [Araneus ventricosus]
MPIPYEKEIEILHKLLAEVETHEDSDLDLEHNGPEDVLKDNFSDHERFSEYDTESEEVKDYGNEEVNNSEWFSSEDGVQCRKTKFRRNIHVRCHNIMSRLPGTQGPAKDVTSSGKS